MDQTKQTVAVIGAGLIGCSWSALFLASGHAVRLYDPRTEAGDIARAFLAEVRPTLTALGYDCSGFDAPALTICATSQEAVTGAEIIMESIPERLDLKQTLYAEIEPALLPHAIVATSSSGLKLSDLQALMTDPARLVIAHPFNPPHLIPLVELYGNDRTAPDVVPIARAFFEGCGKVCIELKKEVPAHVANRLQAALWREAIHLVAEGVATVEDVDKAVWAGPGLRWAVMGPHMLLNLGGGEGGLRAYVNQFADSYAAWWDDLGHPALTSDTVAALTDGLTQEINGRDYATLRATRDTQLLSVLTALRAARA
ncbi:3-hydroxyacyl-CoA dehydrogenase NAD-binding domain-containing protein [Donghicola mangrovi]|uniref:3-hydroxyacyl-CoA dehydrogenase NAD-binding domain-containing protein n=1 Tax=Donghicola mangrovi TaxID=2729614 RepID=UPI0030B856A1